MTFRMIVLTYTFHSFFIIIYKTHTENEKERERQRHRQREKQAPCREPDVGLHPWSPGSRPGPKTALNRWATGAALHISFLTRNKHSNYSLPKTPLPRVTKTDIYTFLVRSQKGGI